MNRFALGLMILSAHALPASAATATLQIDGGEVLLSRGAGYRAVATSHPLDERDTVLARPGSAAKVTFDDGCIIHLKPGAIFTVEKNSPCQSSVANVDGKSSSWASGTDAVAGGDWSATTQMVAVDGPTTNLMPYLLGAATIGGIAAVAAMVGSGGGGDTPVSP